MIVLLWCFAGAAAAVLLECLYRASSRAWWELLPIGAPLSLFISYTVCHIVRQHASLLGALVTWSFAVILCRLFVSLVVLGDRPSPGDWAGYSLIVAAKIVQTIWKEA